MSAQQYMTLLEWPSSRVPSFGELDIQIDAKVGNIRTSNKSNLSVTKNTYPPPGNRIWACRTIQSFCFEPTRDLLKGVIIGIDVGDARRCGHWHGAVFLLFFLHEFFHPGIRR